MYSLVCEEAIGGTWEFEDVLWLYLGWRGWFGLAEVAVGRPANLELISKEAEGWFPYIPGEILLWWRVILELFHVEPVVETLGRFCWWSEGSVSSLGVDADQAYATVDVYSILLALLETVS